MTLVLLLLPLMWRELIPKPFPICDNRLSVCMAALRRDLNRDSIRRH